jgi:hypothetical protein
MDLIKVTTAWRLRLEKSYNTNGWDQPCLAHSLPTHCHCISLEFGMLDYTNTLLGKE